MTAKIQIVFSSLLFFFFPALVVVAVHFFSFALFFVSDFLLFGPFFLFQFCVAVGFLVLNGDGFLGFEL